MSVVATPLGLTTTEAAEAGAEMMAIAARIHPDSPEGFTLGIVIGRLLSAGLDANDIRELVEVTLNHPKLEPVGHG